jgi:hypothetical protein
MSNACLRLSPPASEWSIWIDTFGKNYVDAGLVQCLLTGIAPHGWESILTQQFGLDSSSSKIMLKSYQLYKSLAIANYNGTDVFMLTEEFRKLGSLFNSRADISTNELADWEGVGEFNERCIDLRLLAIRRLLGIDSSGT